MNKRKIYAITIFLLIVLILIPISNPAIVAKAKQIKTIIMVISSEQKLQDDLLAIHELAMKLEPGLSEAKTDLEKVILLRNHIYSKVPLKETSPNFNSWDLFNAYKLSVIDPEYGHICGGLSKQYRVLLEAFGIQTRYVGMFTKPTFPYDSHASAEAFVDGKWIASDPTFNVMFRHNGEYLGYSELRKLVLSGEKYEITSNGMDLDPERYIQDYYVPLDNLIEYLIIHPATVNNKHFATIIEPEEWDGNLILEGKARSTLPSKLFLDYIISNN